MATHLAPFPPDQMPRKDFGLHFFTFLPPQSKEVYDAAFPSKTLWDRFFLHPNISYSVSNKGGTYLNEGSNFGLTGGARIVVPPGYNNFNPGPNVIQTHPNNVVLMARRFADWFEFMGFKRGKGVVLSDGEYAGCIHFKLYGSYSSSATNANPEEQLRQRSLFFNHERADSAGNIISDPEFGDNGRMPYCFGHHTKATLRNRPVSPTHGHTLGDFSKLLMLALKAECDARNLCYPMYIMNDNEDVIALGGSALGGLFYSATAAAFDEVKNPRKGGAVLGYWSNTTLNNRGPNNHRRGMLNTAGEFGQRFDQPIYYDWNGSEWTEKTYLEAFQQYNISVVGPDQNQFPISQWSEYEPDGSGLANPWFKARPSPRNVVEENFTSGITSDGTFSFKALERTNTNRIFVHKIGQILFRLQDHGLSKILWEPAKEVFSHIKCGNVGLVAALDARFPYYDSSNNYIRIPHVSEPAGKRLFKTDYSCPELAGVNQSGYGKYDPIDHRPLEQRSGDDDKHSFGTTRRDVWRNFFVYQVKACYSNQNPIPVIPFMWCPYDNIGGYTPTPEDFLYVLQEHYKMGVRQWGINNQSASGFFNGKSKLEWFMDVVDEFVAWTQTQNPPPPPPPPTANELQPVNPSGVRMSRLRLK